jgi:phenylacetic acid degradation operon negative regulatory protein
VKARSALFTLFGDVVRPAGGEAWLSTITACMQTVGFRSEAVRTALHRMTAEGWVEPRREGRYSAYQLTGRGVARLEEAAARIYRLRSQAWDGRWRLLLAPEVTDRETVATLEWLGYGHLQPGVHVHPHAHPATAVALIERAGVTATWLDEATVGDDVSMARRAWPLTDLEARHRAFLDRWDATAVPDDPSETFALRLQLVHEWRKFLFLDPGLPADVLPDGWPGARAADRFAEVYEALRPASWAYYAQLQRDAPGGGDASRIADADSPFARGLDALGQR